MKLDGTLAMLAAAAALLMCPLVGCEGTTGSSDSEGSGDTSSLAPDDHGGADTGPGGNGDVGTLAPEFDPEEILADPCMECADGQDATTCQPRGSGAPCNLAPEVCFDAPQCVPCATLNHDKGCTPSDLVCSEAPLVDCTPSACETAVLVDDGGECGCHRTPHEEGTPCDDANACTDNDHCVAAKCVGSAVDVSHLDDQCNKWVCLPTKGPAAIPHPDGTLCDDGDPCTTVDACSFGLCIGTVPEAAPCRVHVCTADGLREESAADDAECDDGDPCTVESCSDGTCVAEPLPELDDGLQCTTDICHETGEVEHLYDDGAYCLTDPSDACVYSGQCWQGACYGVELAPDGTPCDAPGGGPGQCAEGVCVDPCAGRQCGESDAGWSCGTCDAPLSPVCSEIGLCVNEMIQVAPALHPMGNNVFNRCMPQVMVMQTATFAMDRGPVTNLQFAAFLAMAGVFDAKGNAYLDCEDPEVRISCSANFMVQPGFGKHPVIEVTEHGARAYCAAVGKRLCREAEFNRVVYGTDGRPYPWGVAPPDGTRVNCCDACDVQCNDGYPSTSPVGAFPDGASQDGIMDLMGVAHWTADWYGCFCNSAIDPSTAQCPTDPGCLGDTPPADPGGPCEGQDSCDSTARRAIYGSSFKEPAAMFINGMRDGATPDTADSGLGFRCCADL